jgi:hypothetical protein
MDQEVDVIVRATDGDVRPATRHARRHTRYEVAGLVGCAVHHASPRAAGEVFRKDVIAHAVGALTLVGRSVTVVVHAVADLGRGNTRARLGGLATVRGKTIAVNRSAWHP